MSNLHPCANKCSEFKEGGQCFHCLINETVNRGVYSMHRTEHQIDHFRDVADMGDDTHISPLCVSKSSENESQGDLSLKENRGAFERFYKAKYMQGMCEIEIKNHHEQFRFNDYANEYWHNIVNRQWHAWNARQPEISAMQIKVDELQVENKILNQAAATHRRNQKHYMDLYHRLVEQLYPYAIDLEDPVDTSISKEYTDGYNRAREIAHYNLLEMMESDVEYICAQCDMLGGEGEA